MNFLLITLCIISLSIYLIHKLTNYLGLQLKYKALALCALLAVTVNFVTILLSPYLTTRYFLLLLGLTLTAAFVVTCYNEKLLQSDRVDAAIDAEKQLSSASAPLPETPAVSAEASSIDEEAPAPVPKTVRTEELPDAAVPDIPADIPASVTDSITDSEAAASEELTEPSVQLAPWQTLPRLCAYTAGGQLPAASANWPVSLWHAAALHMDPTQDKRLRPHTSILQDLLKRVRTTAAVPQRVFHAPALLHKTIAEIVREDIENDRLLKLTVVIAKLVSLDDILDYAYDQKERHNSFNALFAYKKALVRYQSDPYAPFIAIDIINIYKENGAYHEAAHTCYDALSLPAVQAQPELLQELQRSLMYLRATEFVLMRHHLSKTPFNRIPQGYLEEIETVFQNRYMKKNHIKGRLQKNSSQADTQPLLSRLD